MRKAPAGGIVRVSLDNGWKTPPELLECVRAYFGGQIPFDPATTPDNPTGAREFCAGVPGRLFSQGTNLFARCNGLEVRWDLTVANRIRSGVFVNPPYGRELRAWLQKIADEAELGVEIVALLPCSRFEQLYFQEALAVANALCLVRGRVKFISALDGKPVGGNPYASMFVGWNVDYGRWARAFLPVGMTFGLRAQCFASPPAPPLEDEA